jgi:hypothetical protein
MTRTFALTASMALTALAMVGGSQAFAGAYDYSYGPSYGPVYSYPVSNGSVCPNCPSGQCYPSVYSPTYATYGSSTCPTCPNGTCGANGMCGSGRCGTCPSGVCRSGNCSGNCPNGQCQSGLCPNGQCGSGYRGLSGSSGPSYTRPDYATPYSSPSNGYPAPRASRGIGSDYGRYDRSNTTMESPFYN